MRVLPVLIMFFVAPQIYVGQNYASALGLRMGNDNITRTVGLSLQQRVLPKTTFEAILQTDFNHNRTAHVILEKHHSFLTRRLNLYLGAGASIGNEISEFKNPITNEIIRTFNNNTFGADIIFGAELTLFSYNISLDYKPNFNLTDRNPWYVGQVGISVRSVLVSNAQYKKRKRRKTRAKKKRQRERDRKDGDPWMKDWYERTFQK